MALDPVVVIVMLVVAGVVVVLLADFGVLSRIRDQFRTPVEAPWIQAGPSADADADAPTADQIYFHFAERLLDSQVATNDALDAKSGAAVGVGSTILPLTFGLLSISGRTLPGLTQWSLVAAVAVYIILLGAAARTSHIRGIQFRPNIHRLWENSQTFDGKVLRRWVAEEYAASCEVNQLVLAYKARWVGRVVAILYLEGMLISAAAALALVNM